MLQRVSGAMGAAVKLSVMKRMALTRTQQILLERLTSGWELGTDHGMGGARPWIQLGGLGRGGESEYLRWSTVFALLRRGLLAQGGRGPGLSTRYVLTDAGRSAMEPI